MDLGARRIGLAALVAALALTVTGCGGDSSPAGDDGGHDISATPAAQATEAPPADAKVIGVTITKDSVSPAAARIEVKRNQPVVLEIDAVDAGELHVHSSPEQHIEFPAGKSRVQLKIDQPGVVDVEDHHLDKVIVQLEVK